MGFSHFIRFSHTFLFFFLGHGPTNDRCFWTTVSLHHRIINQWHIENATESQEKLDLILIDNNDSVEVSDDENINSDSDQCQKNYSNRMWKITEIV